MHIVRALGVKVPRVEFSEIGDQIEHSGSAAEFIAKGEHGIRGVVAEMPHDQFTLPLAIVVKRNSCPVAGLVKPVDVVNRRVLVVRGVEGASLVR